MPSTQYRTFYYFMPLLSTDPVSCICSDPEWEVCCWLLAEAQAFIPANPWWKRQHCQVSTRLPETRYKETDICVEGTCTWCHSPIIYTEFALSCPNRSRWHCLLLLQETLACVLYIPLSNSAFFVFNSSSIALRGVDLKDGKMKASDGKRVLYTLHATAAPICMLPLGKGLPSLCKQGHEILIQIKEGTIKVLWTTTAGGWDSMHGYLALSLFPPCQFWKTSP